MIDVKIKEFLGFNAHKWLREDFPILYALVRSEVEKGTAEETIVAMSSEIEDVLNAAGMSTDYLQR